MSARYAASPSDVPLWAWYEAAKRVIFNIGPHRLSMTSAGVAYFGFLSLFPAIATLVFCYGLFADVTQLRLHLAALSAVLPDEAVEILFERLEFVVASRNTAGISWGLVLSVVLTSWSGSRGVATLVELIGVAYQQEDTRSIVRSAVLSVFLTVGMLVIVSMTIVLIAVIPVLVNFTNILGLAADLVNWLRWPVLIMLFSGGLCVLYKLAPDRHDARLKWIFPGALIATLLWGMMSVLFSIYVENFGSYDATFGSISAIVVLMLWLYYSAFIIALGAELNAELELSTRVDTTVGPGRPLGLRKAYVADNVKDAPVDSP